MLCSLRQIKGNESKFCTEKNGVVVSWTKEPETKEAIFLSFLVLVRLDYHGNLTLGTINTIGIKLKPEKVQIITFWPQISVLCAQGSDCIHIYEWKEKAMKLECKFFRKNPGYAPNIDTTSKSCIRLKWTLASPIPGNSQQFFTLDLSLPSFECKQFPMIESHSPDHPSSFNSTPSCSVTPQSVNPKPHLPDEAPSQSLLSQATSANRLSTLSIATQPLDRHTKDTLHILLKYTKTPEDQFIKSQLLTINDKSQMLTFFSNMEGLSAYRRLRLMFAQSYLSARNGERLELEAHAQRTARRGVLVKPVCRLCQIGAGKKTLWQLAGALQSSENRVASAEPGENNLWIIKRSTDNPSKPVSGHLACYNWSAHRNGEVWQQIKKAKQISTRLAQVSQILADSSKTSSFFSSGHRTSDWMKDNEVFL